MLRSVLEKMINAEIAEEGKFRFAEKSLSRFEVFSHFFRVVSTRCYFSAALCVLCASAVNFFQDCG